MIVLHHADFSLSVWKDKALEVKEIAAWLKHCVRTYFYAKKDDRSNSGQIKCIRSAAFAHVKLFQRVLRLSLKDGSSTNENVYNLFKNEK